MQTARTNVNQREINTPSHETQTRTSDKDEYSRQFKDDNNDLFSAATAVAQRMRSPRESRSR